MNQQVEEMLSNDFFDRDAAAVAKDLIGKIICRKINNLWLKVRIIETEAYYIHDKASHSSLGLTPSRKAMFMPAGTIYMYYARGRASLNISVQGDGNAVLIKSGYLYNTQDREQAVDIMRKHYNQPDREVEKLCNGQTLLCQALNITVPEWNKKNFDSKQFYIQDDNIRPKTIIQTTRLGIPKGRDEHLPYRFIDSEYGKFCTKFKLK